MIEIVSFTPEHLQKIAPRECHHSENLLEVTTNAVTFLLNGNPIAILGWYLVMPGIIQVWGILSDTIRKVPIAFHKSVRTLIAFAFDKYQARRMQMSVRSGYRAGWDWAQSLGFSCEGIMKRYGQDGADYWLFARCA